MASIDEEERNAAVEAERAIRTLSPLIPSPNIAATVKVLRNATLVATSARQAPTNSSEGPTNDARDEIGFALPGLIRELENGPLTREKIDRAKRAVEDWKNKLAVNVESRTR
jgi:hypothetical protein